MSHRNVTEPFELTTERGHVVCIFFPGITAALDRASTFGTSEWRFEYRWGYGGWSVSLDGQPEDWVVTYDEDDLRDLMAGLSALLAWEPDQQAQTVWDVAGFRAQETERVLGICPFKVGDRIEEARGEFTWQGTVSSVVADKWRDDGRNSGAWRVYWNAEGLVRSFEGFLYKPNGPSKFRRIESDAIWQA